MLVFSATRIAPCKILASKTSSSRMIDWQGVPSFKKEMTLVCEDHYLVWSCQRKAEDSRSRVTSSPPKRNAGLVSKVHLHDHLVASVTYIHILQRN